MHDVRFFCDCFHEFSCLKWVRIIYQKNRLSICLNPDNLISNSFKIDPFRHSNWTSIEKVMNRKNFNEILFYFASSNY